MADHDDAARSGQLTALDDSRGAERGFAGVEGADSHVDSAIGAHVGSRAATSPAPMTLCPTGNNCATTYLSAGATPILSVT